MCPPHGGWWRDGAQARVSTGRAWNSPSGRDLGVGRVRGPTPELTSGLSRVGTPHTCAGQGHPPVLLLVGGALVGARGRYGKGGGCRQGASVTVQLATGGHDDPVVVGEERELWRGRSHPQPFPSQPPGLRGRRGGAGGAAGGACHLPGSPPAGRPRERKPRPPSCCRRKAPATTSEAGHCLGQRAQAGGRTAVTSSPCRPLGTSSSPVTDRRAPGPGGVRSPARRAALARGPGSAP